MTKMKKRIRILFFDMEFANGKIPGSVYSFGYLATNAKFKVKMPQDDILINPDCAWNNYVVHHILAYPLRTVRKAPKFPEVYKKIGKLFKKTDIAVGFAVGNDVHALKKDCERYGLNPIPYRYFDMEKLCKLTKKHPEAHGLSGCVKAFCGEVPKNQHRSDGDAYATMLLLQAVCKELQMTPSELFAAFPSCMGEEVKSPCGNSESKKTVSKKSVDKSGVR